MDDDDDFLEELRDTLDICALKYLEELLHYKYIEPTGKVSWDPSCFSQDELEVIDNYYNRCCNLIETGEVTSEALFIQQIFVMWFIKENE